MKFRSALLSMIVLAFLAHPVAAGPEPQSVPAPALPQIPSTDKVNGFPLAYKSASGTPFGNACHICPDDVLQGELDDCFLLSSLAAIATVSPGTIQSIIKPVGQDPDGNEVYNIVLHPARTASDDPGPAENVGAENAFPGLKSPSGIMDFIGTRAYASAAYWKGVLRGQSFFYYAQPPSDGSLWSQAKNSNGTIWTMIMEEAFAQTRTGGYQSFVGGGLSFEAMKTITGNPGGGYIVGPKGPATSPAVVKSVFIQDSPAVADVGGHSIIGGILRGDLKAVQPNLKVCAAPSGTKQPGNCTQICQESHSCRQPLTGGGVPLAKDEKLHVTLMDVDRPGSEHVIAEFDEDDPSTCTEQMPCTHQVPDGPWVLAGPVVVSFVVRKSANPTLGAGIKGVLTTTAEIDDTLTQLQSQHRAVTAGTVGACDLASGRSSLCDQAFDQDGIEHNHDYFLKQYDRATGTITLGNPHGSVVSLSLDEFLQAFYQIAYNEVAIRTSPCGCN